MQKAVITKLHARPSEIHFFDANAQQLPYVLMKPSPLQLHLQTNHPEKKVFVKNVVGDEPTLQLNSVLLSNNLIQRRATEMSTDINKEVFREVQSTKH